MTRTKLHSSALGTLLVAGIPLGSILTALPAFVASLQGALSQARSAKALK
jgi:hypothetical protein